MSSNFSLAPAFHAVVIGGAGDIGAAISNQFCDLGATVTATGANDADLARSLLKPRTGLALATLDVTDDAAVKSFAQSHQRVDALINCAGILAREALPDAPEPANAATSDVLAASDAFVSERTPASRPEPATGCDVR